MIKRCNLTRILWDCITWTYFHSNCNEKVSPSLTVGIFLSRMPLFLQNTVFLACKVMVQGQMGVSFPVAHYNTTADGSVFAIFPVLFIYYVSGDVEKHSGSAGSHGVLNGWRLICCFGRVQISFLTKRTSLIHIRVYETPIGGYAAAGRGQYNSITLV